MGIPAYFVHIVKNHPDILKTLTQENVVDNFYIDSNSIVYDCVHAYNGQNSENFENTIIIETCKKIDEYIAIVKPKNKVIIAFDGVAPVAKLNQQRERRYKSWLEKAVIGQHKHKWDTCAITPGTKFMACLSEGITSHFSDRNNLDITISSSEETGEGEHKIYDAIRSAPTYHKNTTTVVYGLDADLIMLSLNHLNIAHRLYLYRETPHFIKSIDRSLEPGCSYVIDVPLFAEQLGNSLEGINKTMKDPVSITRDYVFMCFFLGNDFLPHFPSLNIRTNGIDTLLETYKKCSATRNFCLVQGTNINWKCLRSFIHELAKGEHERIKSEHNMRDYRSKRPPRPRDGESEAECRLINIPMYERNIEKYIAPEKEDWEWRYYKTLLDVEINNERKRDICVNYLEGLEWTLAYYTTGCKNFRWTYKYHYPPLLTDLAEYTPGLDTTFVESDNLGPVSPTTQLAYVLPRSSLVLLPNKMIREILENTRPHWYEAKVELLWAYCKYFWESHAVLPHINLNELEQLVTTS